jgi:AraC-like DNA-binding protein
VVMPAPELTVLAAWTATVVRALDARGIDGVSLARAAGIDPAVFAQDDARIPLSLTTELWRLAVDATADPCFGIEVSRHVRPGTFRALGVGIVASETLREALDRSVRFACLVLSGERENLTRMREGCYEVVMGLPPGPVQPSNEAMEAIMGTLVRTARFLVDRTAGPVAVHLRRPTAPATDRFERFFGCPVTYGAEQHVLAFDAALVDRPLPAACSEVARTADHLAAQYLDRTRPVGFLTDEVRCAVMSLLEHGEPTPATVAARLAMSARTLQRRLHDEGTTFRDVVTEARLTLAKQLLTTERLGSHQLAHRLGFSDPAAFRRAFKRGTGVTPAAFVAQVRGTPAVS